MRIVSALVAALAVAFMAGAASAAVSLMTAVKIGDIERIAERLDAGIDPDSRDLRYGATLLHWAADAETVNLLLDRGATPEARSNTGITALHFMVRDGRISAARVLIERGLDVDIESSESLNTPLMNVAKRGTPEVAEFLIAAGADVNRANVAGTTPLYWAAKYNTAAMLDTLLDAGADPTARVNEQSSDLGFAPLDAARKYNRSLRSTHALAWLEAATEAAACDGYLVQEGDSPLSVVAEKALGDAERWQEIARLNNISWDNPYYLGQCLAMPG